MQSLAFAEATERSWGTTEVGVRPVTTHNRRLSVSSRMRPLALQLERTQGQLIMETMTWVLSFAEGSLGTGFYAKCTWVLTSLTPGYPPKYMLWSPHEKLTSSKTAQLGNRQTPTQTRLRLQTQGLVRRAAVSQQDWPPGSLPRRPPWFPHPEGLSIHEPHRKEGHQACEPIRWQADLGRLLPGCSGPFTIRRQEGRGGPQGTARKIPRWAKPGSPIINSKCCRKPFPYPSNSK